MRQRQRIGQLFSRTLPWLFVGHGAVVGAQVGGRVTGTVADQAGHGIADAIVTIAAANADDVEVRTGPDGTFHQAGLPAGTYSVTAVKAALGGEVFRIYVRDGATVAVDFVLEPGRRVADWLTEDDMRDALSRAFDTGIASFRANELAAAAEAFEQTVALDRRCLECWFNLAVTYATAERFDDAELMYRAALDLDPDYAPAYRGLAQLYDTLQRPADAEAARRQLNRLAGAGNER